MNSTMHSRIFLIQSRKLKTKPQKITTMIMQKNVE